MLPSKTPSRIDAAQAALSFVGTPFRLQGRVPGVGLDCLGVLVCAGRLAGFECMEPVPRYGGLPNPGEREMYTPYLVEIDRGDAGAGDALLMHVGARGIHGGLIVDGGRLVHALACSPRSVVAEALATLRWPVARAFRYKE